MVERFVVTSMKGTLKKIPLPKFFKTKKFFFLVACLGLIFLFTPLSLHQISNQIEGFIHDKAKVGVEKFETQTGLKIEWEKLKFNILTMNVKLENVKILLSSVQDQRIQLFSFLDGLQRVKLIVARPSLYSLFFEKKIILSKLQINQGDVYLKTLFPILTNKKEIKKLNLPIKKIVIRNTNLKLTHNKHKLVLLNVKSKIAQKKQGAFHFSFFVKEFFMNKEKESHISGLNLQNKDLVDPVEKEKIFQLTFKGMAKKNQISFKKIKLKNQKFQSLVQKLIFYFDFKGLKGVDIQSSGSLPFSFIKEGFDFIGRKIFSFDSLLSYELDINYRKHQGYKGYFDFQGKQAVFQTLFLNNFSINGKLNNNRLIIETGFINIQNHGNINIQKGEWVFKKKPFRFHFSVKINQLPSDLITRSILDLKKFPIQADLTGSVDCSGIYKNFSILQCEFKGKSKEILVKSDEEDKILSLYNTNLNANIKWNNPILKWVIDGKRGSLSNLSSTGTYSQALNKVEALYSFYGDLSKDLKFYTPFPIKGRIQIDQGKLLIHDDHVLVEGFALSPLLRIQSYNLQNVSSFYKLENRKLNFFDFQGKPGKTNYLANFDIDFDKKEFVLKSNFSFFDIEDLLKTVKEKFSFPFNVQGTGAGSFFLKIPWSSPKQKEFKLKGNLFNVFINKDLFQQVAFDLGIQKQKGLVHSLFFKKGQGSIQGSGTFDKDFSLNLNFIGKKLSLERLDWLNRILKFNQSGNIDFDMKLTGSLEDPKASGNAFISDTFFYFYPVNNSHIKFTMDKKVFSFSGDIINEIFIEKFIYPFSKNSKMFVKGQFKKFDFIKLILSKNRIEKVQNYNSQLTGSFSLFPTQNESESWNGDIKIDKVLIAKSNKWIESKKPFSILFNKYGWFLTPTNFSHYNNKKLFIEKRKNNTLFLSGETSLSFVSVLFPFFNKFDGDIKGQLIINDNLKKLNPRGSLQVRGGLFSLDVLPDFTNIRSAMTFSKDKVFINQFSSLVGGGELKGKGTISYNFVSAPRLNLDLNFSDTQLNIPEDFHTKGSGKIQIQGKAPPYLISGKYIIDSGNIVKDFSKSTKNIKYKFSFLNREIEKKFSIFKLKLNIGTKQPVNINSSLIRSSIEGEANIYGQMNSLLMDGQFAFSQTNEENLIFFRGQEFEISSGSILFENSHPENPHLNIKAHTLFKENIIEPLESNQEIERKYKISLSLIGPAQNSKFFLESDSSLSEKEIISLLTLGVSSRHFDANVKQDITDYSYQILGSLLLEKPLNQEIKNVLGLDFRLTPYINTLNKPVTKITLSKSWFEKWKSSFSRTIEDAQSEIRLKYDLNKKVSLTAFWENTGQIDLEDNQKDRLGLDVEFNFDF